MGLSLNYADDLIANYNIYNFKRLLRAFIWKYKNHVSRSR